MKDATEDDAVVGNGWEEETGVDDLNVDQSLRNIRAAERERRLAEHRRIKLEKEQQRKAKTKQFMATKISWALIFLVNWSNDWFKKYPTSICL